LIEGTAELTDLVLTLALHSRGEISLTEERD
jgi:hypothetical protein